MNTFLKLNFMAWLERATPAAATEILEVEVTEEAIKKWKGPTRQPPVDVLSAYVEKIMVPGLLEKFAKDKAKAVEEATAEMQAIIDENNLDFQAQTTRKPTTDQDVIEEEPVERVKPRAPEPAPQPIVPSGGSLVQMLKAAAESGELPAETIKILRDLFFQWEGRRVCFMLPFHKLTNPATAFMMLSFALDLGKEKMRVLTMTGDAQIHHSRSNLATEFLKTDCEWSMWIDDDMIIPFGNADRFTFYGSLPSSYPKDRAGMHAVTRLVSHGKTLVGGCYFGRQPSGKAMFHEGKNDPAVDKRARTMPDVILPTKWVGTGCMLVHRNVYLDIQKKFAELAPVPGRPYWNFFLPMADAGEDASFCIRAAEAGHQPFVDLACQPLHVGYACYGAHNTNPNFAQ